MYIYVVTVECHGVSDVKMEILPSSVAVANCNDAYDSIYVHVCVRS